jgi:hypothetical protein
VRAISQFWRVRTESRPSASAAWTWEKSLLELLAHLQGGGAVGAEFGVEGAEEAQGAVAAKGHRQPSPGVMVADVGELLDEGGGSRMRPGSGCVRTGMGRPVRASVSGGAFDLGRRSSDSLQPRL